MVVLVMATAELPLVPTETRRRLEGALSAHGNRSRPGDPRLGSIVTDGRDGTFVIIGFPADEGCIRNGGRSGAKGGPDAFRRFFGGMGTVVNPEYDVDLRDYLAVSDAGNVAGDTLEDMHAGLREVVADVVQGGGIPIVIGGGNDQSAPNGFGALDGLQRKHGEGGVAPPLAIVNIDAHLDVRPLMDDGRPTSGTPFRQLLESGQIGHGNFTEFAAQGSQCSANHAEYVRDRGGRIVWLSQLDGEITPKVFDQAVLGPAARKALFLSFDIDSIQSSDCPGVSCPATVGITAADAMAICRRCGAHDGLTVVDFSELNPAVEDYRTPRLVVNLVYNLLLGYALKQKGKRS
eukprot:s159_g11.t1